MTDQDLHIAASRLDSPWLTRAQFLDAWARYVAVYERWVAQQ